MLGTILLKKLVGRADFSVAQNGISTMDVKIFLERIGLNGEDEIKLDLETLAKIQRRFLEHITYENIDIIFKKKIPLDA